MKLEIREHDIVLTREASDPKFYGVRNGVGESRLLHYLAQHLRRLGHDVIKKRMWKDGHLVDDLQQYVRTRSHESGFMIFNAGWSIQGGETSWNAGQVILALSRY